MSKFPPNLCKFPVSGWGEPHRNLCCQVGRPGIACLIPRCQQDRSIKLIYIPADSNNHKYSDQRQTPVQRFRRSARPAFCCDGSQRLDVAARSFTMLRGSMESTNGASGALFFSTSCCSGPMAPRRAMGRAPTRVKSRGGP